MVSLVTPPMAYQSEYGSGSAAGDNSSGLREKQPQLLQWVTAACQSWNWIMTPHHLGEGG